MSRIIKYCKDCEKELSRKSSYNPNAKWCRSCFIKTGLLYKSIKGRIPWNKGKKTGKNELVSFHMRERWKKAYEKGLNTIVNSGIHPLKGKVGANFGKKVPIDVRIKQSISALNSYKKGRTHSKPGLGKIPWNKGLKGFMAGEKNPRWIKDRTKVKQYWTERNNPEYKYWRKQVWLRDNWKCKIANPDCNGRIEAHHILGWRSHPELRYQVNNGITLCHAHHPRKRSDEAKLSPYFQKLVAEMK